MGLVCNGGIRQEDREVVRELLLPEKRKREKSPREEGKNPNQKKKKKNPKPQKKKLGARGSTTGIDSGFLEKTKRVSYREHLLDPDRNRRKSEED